MARIIDSPDEIVALLILSSVQTHTGIGRVEFAVDHSMSQPRDML